MRFFGRLVVLEKIKDVFEANGIYRVGRDEIFVCLDDSLAFGLAGRIALRVPQGIARSRSRSVLFHRNNAIESEVFQNLAAAFVGMNDVEFSLWTETHGDAFARAKSFLTALVGA